MKHSSLDSENESRRNAPGGRRHAWRLRPSAHGYQPDMESVLPAFLRQTSTLTKALNPWQQGRGEHSGHLSKPSNDTHHPNLEQHHQSRINLEFCVCRNKC